MQHEHPPRAQAATEAADAPPAASTGALTGAGTRHRRRQVLRLGAGLGGLSVAGLALAADAYPSRPIELWVGFSAGSGTDTHARLLAVYLSRLLGQPMVVVNKAGASGVLMWSELARSKPDGYTLGMINYPGLAAMQAITRLTFDPLKDYQYIGNATADPVILAVGPKSPYKTLAALVAAAKAKPGGLSVGVTGKASQDFLTAVSIERETGVKFKYVVFPGNNEGIAALMGGHLDIMTMVSSTGASFFKSGELGVLAVGMDEPMAEFPNVPTFKSLNVNLFGGGSFNYKALAGPAHLPLDVATRLNAALVSVTKDPEFVQRVKAMGAFAYYMDGPAFLALATKNTALAQDFLQKKPGGA